MVVKGLSLPHVYVCSFDFSTCQLRPIQVIIFASSLYDNRYIIIHGMFSYGYSIKHIDVL